MSTATTSPQSQENGSARRRKDPPERKYGPFSNGVGVCIWTNQVQTDNGPRSFRTITINPRRYFDRESNQWKDAPSFNPSDLPSLIFALQRAAEYCFEQHAPDADAGEGQQPPNGGEDIPF